MLRMDMCCMHARSYPSERQMAAIVGSDRIQFFQIEWNDFGGQGDILLFFDFIVWLVRNNSDFFGNIKCYK